MLLTLDFHLLRGEVGGGRVSIPQTHQLTLEDVPTISPPRRIPEQRPQKDVVGTQITNPSCVHGASWVGEVLQMASVHSLEDSREREKA